MNDQSPQSPDRTHKMSLLKLRRAINQIKEMTRDVINPGQFLVSRAGVARILTMSVCWGHRPRLYAENGYCPPESCMTWFCCRNVLSSGRTTPHRSPESALPSCGRKRRPYMAPLYPTDTTLLLPAQLMSYEVPFILWKGTPSIISKF